MGRLGSVVMASTLLALFAAAWASSVFASTISTTMSGIEFDEPVDKQKKPSYEECGKQIQKAQQLYSCQQYLRQSTQPSTPPTMNDWRVEFPRCCDQLEKIDKECRCEAIRQLIQQQQQEHQGPQGGGGGGSAETQTQSSEMQEILRTAKSLTGLCRIKPESCCEVAVDGTSACM